jgi:hypothetical protein
MNDSKRNLGQECSTKDMYMKQNLLMNNSENKMGCVSWQIVMNLILKPKHS